MLRVGGQVEESQRPVHNENSDMSVPRIKQGPHKEVLGI